MKKVQFVTALHGDEPMPVFALASKGIKQYIANLPALIEGVRFIDFDMNMGFGLDGEGSESKSINRLMHKLDPKIPVIDLHTFSTKSEPFAIVVDKAMIPLAQTLGVKHIVYMKHNIKQGHALLNYFHGVSVECGNHKDMESLKTALNVVKAVKKGISYPCSIYEAYGIIEKPGHYKNFTFTGEFYPVLAGEKAYTFIGLKAKKIK